MNALKHGLRARSFGILPEESHAEWAEHVQDLRQGYGPVDAARRSWSPRSRSRCGTRSAPTAPWSRRWRRSRPAGRALSHGTNMQEPENARSMGTAIRYMTAAGMATQRAQRAFFQPQGQAGRADPARGRARRGAGQPEWHERIHARTRPPRHLACCGRARSARMHERFPAARGRACARAAGGVARPDRPRARWPRGRSRPAAAPGSGAARPVRRRRRPLAGATSAVARRNLAPRGRRRLAMPPGARSWALGRQKRNGPPGRPGGPIGESRAPQPLSWRFSANSCRSCRGPARS